MINLATPCTGGRIGASLQPYLLRKHPAKVFIETGTQWSGGILTALCVGFYREIHSIDTDYKHYYMAKELFAGNPLIHLSLGDSAIDLGNILKTINEPALIWLDAHADNEPTPLYAELEAISQHSIRNHVIMIDDRRMWGCDWACWTDVTEEKIVGMVKTINPAYKISWADSWNGPKDIFIADIR